MKKIFISLSVVLLMSVIAFSASAQTAEMIPTVAVNGQSQIRVLPDEIYLSIRLDESDTKGRLTIEEQRRKMFSALKRAGVDAEKQLFVQDMSSSYFRRSRSLAATLYELKLSSADAVRKVFDELDAAGITNVTVTRTSHSDMDGLRRQARQKAIQDAQQRARDLAEAIGQSIGACYEISDYTTSTQPVYRKNMLMATSAAMDAVAQEAEPEVQFEQIEITYSVSAKFYLNTK
ncbi:MAG: SIMPL domain-containing protein [Rikenellaceae bacterium]|nr:SIMPL domain-containing protein [Rikenellaceae bacterium]